MSHAERNEITPAPTEVGSLWEPASRERAASLAAQGLPIGVYNRGVCAIWGDGANKDFVDAILQIKGEKRGERPMGASLPTSDFVTLLDPAKIPENLRSVFLVAEELASRTGSLCFIRGPVTQEAASSLPGSIVSWVEGTPIVQNWDAQGHKPTYLFLKTLMEKGVAYPAVTSMNVSGTPEIVDQDAGIAFSRAKHIPYFLTDPKDTKNVIGSYTILSIGQAGVELVRDGNIPGHVFATLLGTRIETSRTIPAKYPQPTLSPELTDGLDPREARIAILSSLHNFPEAKIQATLAKLKQ